MDKHADFVRRLKNTIAANQGAKPEDISVARAAKEIGIAETTLRSTLQGRYPRSEDYWRKLRTYCRATLDWLICGLGDPPEHAAGAPRERILVAERDRHRLELIRLALKGLNVEVACTPQEAAHLISDNVYDLILSGSDMAWTPEGLTLLERHQIRPRLILLADDPAAEDNPFRLLADQTIDAPLQAERISALVRRQLERVCG